MKFVRYGLAGKEKPGLLRADGSVVDLSSLVADITPGMADFNGLLSLSEQTLNALPAVAPGVRFGCPIANTGKVVAIGLNYREHARESGAEIPREPIIFMKSTTSINGPFDDVVLPYGSEKTDWEVELGVVIGKRAKRVSEAEALSHVLGYCIVNDVSERAHQLERGGQWTKGKSHDTFCPIGPWLVTRDEVPDPQNLRLWCEVNGVRLQNSNTSDMIFPVAQCISYISQFMTLMPGDVITTGTPQGVGLGFKPPRFLVGGDRMRLGIDHLGVQEQKVQAAR
jgi:2-keto-4-pentenoate hydratase/2-oxohepta-3-ene-1,7-dioic acid hydratase in catechol pathway